MQREEILVIHLRCMPRLFFETYSFDAITLSPYMGEDTSKPFLEYEKKWIVILALTSNESAKEIQHFTNLENEKLYESCD